MTDTTATEFLEMREAIDLLVEFGDAYSLACSIYEDQDPEGKLVETTQTLLAVLTNQAATPLDVEEVLPFDQVLADA